MASTKSIQQQIFRVLWSSIQYVPNSLVLRNDEDLSELSVINKNRFFPDFLLKWCPKQCHYRVYIFVAPDVNTEKTNAGFSIMVIKSPMTAAQFAAMYKTIYGARSNEKF